MNRCTAPDRGTRRSDRPADPPPSWPVPAIAGFHPVGGQDRAAARGEHRRGPSRYRTLFQRTVQLRTILSLRSSQRNDITRSFRNWKITIRMLIIISLHELGSVCTKAGGPPSFLFTERNIREPCGNVAPVRPSLQQTGRIRGCFDSNEPDRGKQFIDQPFRRADDSR